MNDKKDPSKNIGNLEADFKELKSSLGIASKKKRLLKLESESVVDGFWDNQEKARSVMQEIGGLKSEIDEVEELESDLKALTELVNDGVDKAEISNEYKQVKSKYEKLKISSLLSSPYDSKNAIMSMHAGQGGTEAMDWVSMLYRMYIKYFESRGWKVDVLDISEGEEAGIKSTTFRVSGKYSFGYLKHESGTHRLVRQSPFNADKLRQTSFALVEVLPELAEVDLPDIEIRDDDLDWQFFRASSQGGQNVQKVSTAVRLTHKPTGIVVTAQTERYQEQNRKYALNLLRAKLWAKAQEESKQEAKSIKGEYKPASWGNQIRSYVLHPYKMVKDLRTKVEVADAESVLDGDLDIFIEAELKQLSE